jgi:hypothetical protein
MISYKIITSKKAIVSSLALLLALGVYSQDCRIFNTGRKSFYFSDTGAIAQMYTQVAEDSLRFSALLITMNGQTQTREVIYMTVDPSGHMMIKFVVNDSLLFMRSLVASSEDLEVIFETNNLDGFYESTCKSTSSHQIETFVVSNPKSKTWIELTSFNSPLSSALKENKSFSYLYNVYFFLLKKQKNI